MDRRRGRNTKKGMGYDDVQTIRRKAWENKDLNHTTTENHQKQERRAKNMIDDEVKVFNALKDAVNEALEKDINPIIVIGMLNVLLYGLTSSITKAKLSRGKGR